MGVIEAIAVIKKSIEGIKKIRASRSPDSNAPSDLPSAPQLRRPGSSLPSFIPLVDDPDPVPELTYQNSPSLSELPKTHICSYCGDNFSSRDDLRRHQRGHGEWRFKCKICSHGYPEKSFVFRTIEALDEHVAGCHICPVSSCYRSDPSRPFPRRGLLKHHLIEVHDWAHLCEVPGSALGALAHEPEYLPAESPIPKSKSLEKRETHLQSSSPEPPQHIDVNERFQRRLRNPTSAPKRRNLLSKNDLSKFSFQSKDGWRSYETFRERSEEAFAKLTAAKLDNHRSQEFSKFVDEIGAVDEVIHTGCETLQDFINKRIPGTLSKLYCMLHVCYALSKSSSKDSAPMTEEAFAKSVTEWKGCLPVISDSGVREQDLFDEIQTVMWEEISEGLEFMNDLLEKVANEPGSPLLQPIDDWESILDPRFFQDFCDLDPGGGHGCTMTLSEDTPSECNSPPPISWEILFSNAIIVTALEVFKDIGEIGVTLLCTCGLVFKWLRNSPIAREATPKIVQRLDISQRQEVLESAYNSLNLEVCPAISKVFELVSHPFLKGVIDDLHQLEKCTISLLKSFELSSADLEHFILVTISHFRHHHLTRLPQVFKHEADEYNSPSYVSRRILEEIKPSVDPPILDISIASSAQSVNLALTSSHRVSPTVSGTKRSADSDLDKERNVVEMAGKSKATPSKPGSRVKTDEFRIIPYEPGGNKRRRRGAVIDEFRRRGQSCN